jgi:hypothetical protein
MPVQAYILAEIKEGFGCGYPPENQTTTFKNWISINVQPWHIFKI